MYIQYGDYQHASGEGALSISQQAEYSRGGVLTGVRARMEVRGRIQIEDQGDADANLAALSAALNDLETAYAVNGLDFGLYADDGSPTQHVLLSAATIGGTRVVNPVSYPIGSGAEYSTFRNYELAVEGFVPNWSAGLIEWQESVIWSGGGAEYVFLQTLSGPPQKQLRYQQTPYRATQSGFAVGNLSYVSAPAPLWPDSLQPPLCSVAQISPDRMGAFIIPYRNYRTHWNYVFEDVSPLFGLPNFWGG